MEKLQFLQRKRAVVTDEKFLFLFLSRARRSHWENLNPASGRPLSSAHAKLDRQWDLQPGHKDLSQNKDLTTDEELKELAARSQEA